MFVRHVFALDVNGVKTGAAEASFSPSAQPGDEAPETK